MQIKQPLIALNEKCHRQEGVLIIGKEIEARVEMKKVIKYIDW